MKEIKEKNYYRGWVTNAWRKEDADAEVIRLQKCVIVLLFILCIAFGIGWMTAPSRLTIYVPPDIQNGATMKADAVSLPLIYSFAYEVWQEINYWPVDGESDYKKNLAAQSADHSKHDEPSCGGSPISRAKTCFG